MNILLCGAQGCLARHIEVMLSQAGHHIIRAQRHATASNEIAVDFSKDIDVRVWEKRLDNIDCVINAVGILNEKKQGDFELIHTKTPMALFQACHNKGVKKVIQISALGAGNTPYLPSKYAADEYLRTLMPEQGFVLRPSLIFSLDGTSTQFFLSLASMPLLINSQQIANLAPVHINDLLKVINTLVEKDISAEIIAVMGSEKMTYQQLLNCYRANMQLHKAPYITLPALLVSIMAKITGCFSNSILSSDTWRMLCAQATFQPEKVTALISTSLTAPANFIAKKDAELARLRAMGVWRRQLSIYVITAIWLLTAIICLFFYPRADSLALLSQLAIADWAQLPVFYFSCGLDFVLGILSLLMPSRRLWWTQILIILSYSILIAIGLSEYYLHPFAPIIKNLAVLALLFMLLAEEKKS